MTPPTVAPVIAVQPSQTDRAESESLEALLHGAVVAHLAAIRYNNEVEALTWERLEAGCLASPQYRLLHHTVQQGVPENSKDWALQIQPFFRHRRYLSTLGPVVLLYDRPVIPSNLRQDAMDHLHAAHGCANMMFSRAASSLYWPNYREDINQFQTACRTCRRIATSNPSLPPTAQPDLPTYPFESVVADFLSFEGRNYLAMADRYSNWIPLFKLFRDDAQNLIQALRNYSTCFGIQRDHLPTPLHKLDLRSDWQRAAKLREECFMKRHYAKCEEPPSKGKLLPPLIPGDAVYVQDQDGRTVEQFRKSA